MAKINIVIDDESVARFGGLHVKRYYADLIVMTDTDIIKNDLDAGDNSEWDHFNIQWPQKEGLSKLKNMQFSQKEALSLPPKF